jgi:predicted metal-dependent peptidase
VQSVERVFDPKKLELKGGGGTEIDRLIVEAAELKPRPQLIVVATDGYTPWPAAAVGIPVVACLTQDAAAELVPKWIKTVVLS